MMSPNLRSLKKHVSIGRLVFSLLLCCILSTSVVGQVSHKKLKSSGDEYFKTENYRQALNFYVRYNQYQSGDDDVLKKMAICQFHNNQVDKAQENLEQLAARGELSQDSEGLYYLGEVYGHQGDFNQAASYYKKSLNATGASKRRRDILQKLMHCESALDIVHFPSLGFIENLGPLVNSIEDDLMPLYSKNHADRIYFASNFDRDEANPLNAKKSFDIYSSELKEGSWVNPTLFPKKFSSSRDEFPLDFFDDGNVMYFQRGSVGGARILIDSLKAQVQDSVNFAQAQAPLFPELGDRNVHNYSDSIIIFSSRRPGGYGGLDLYYTVKSSFGWSKPRNMGEEINSPYDDVDAFLTDNGATIYFSSDRPASMGGFDIFQSRYDVSTHTWGSVKNLGRPVNTFADELGTQIASNGMSVIFSSNRKNGYGGHDLYVVYPEVPIGDMSLVRGQVIPAFLHAPLFASKDEVVPATPVVEQPTSVNEEIDVVEEKPIVQAPPVIDENIYPKTKVDVLPIYYSASDVVLNPQSVKELNKIANVLMRYPNLSVKLISHSSGYEGPKHFDLYFSVRRAEQIVNYLLERGVSNSAITILGVGEQYPYAKRIINGEVAGFSTKLNRRIDLMIDGGSQYNLSFDYIDGGLGSDYVDEGSKTLSTLLNGLSFKSQIKVASQVYKDEILASSEHPMVEKLLQKNSYYYSVGWSKSFSEVDRLTKRLQGDGFNQAKTIAYINGHRIDRNTAEALRDQYPELRKYLK